MLFRSRLENPALVLRVGLVTFLLASLANYFVRPAPGPAADWADGVKGLLYGVAIATMLLSLAARKRRG